jgi:GNAT superfamily N-acetyltransferase
MLNQLAIRNMTRSDLAFADQLRASEGWNQTIEDWQRLLLWEPKGCFLALWQGKPAGTVTTTIYGPIGWVGMMLVDSRLRRHGIGQSLLEHALQYLDRRHVQCAKLDATPLGRALYRRFDFQAEGMLTRWERHETGSPAPFKQKRIRPITLEHLTAIRQLDVAAFGVDRFRILREIALANEAALVHLGTSARVDGFGFLRKGARSLYLGPVIAQTTEAGRDLVCALLARSHGLPVFWDTPEANEAAAALAPSLGFKPQRPLVRMFRGPNQSPGDFQKQFALADPAVG